MKETGPQIRNAIGVLRASKRAGPAEGHQRGRRGHQAPGNAQPDPMTDTQQRAAGRDLVPIPSASGGPVSSRIIAPGWP